MIMKMVEVLNCTNLDTDQIIIRRTFGFTKEVNTSFFRTTFVYGVIRHFQQYFSYIMAVSFIGGGNWRKPPTCRNEQTNLIT